ncbi:MAG: DNA polymerase domain-containing protein, partial [Chloroflexota bacterium]|nr:DNA polymerase domain-containing protein [Chloroflexota bacterium]
MSEYKGWLLDLYTRSGQGVILWLLGDNEIRYRFTTAFPITFYAAGASSRLRELWKYLQSQPVSVKLSRTQQRELFHDDALTVLAVRVEDATAQRRLFHQVARRYPNLTYYNADIPMALRYAAVFGTFPLARCRITADEEYRLQTIEVLDSPWDLDPDPPPLRILQLRPNCDPSHDEPTHLLAKFGDHEYHFSLNKTRPLLVGLGSLLRRHDPDLLLTAWGDSWLLPTLLATAKERGIPLLINREPALEIMQRPERTYHSYGQVIYRGPKLTLFGRWHIDIYNTVMFHDYGLEGVLEMARVTGLPVQTAARVSPGTGVSAMQMRTALQEGILVPWHKQQTERPKSALTLMHTDKGGLVYKPIIGLHPHVAEIDFTSMYPSIMVHFNISPETVGKHAATDQPIPDLDISVDQTSTGLIPKTLAPLLEKRIALKGQLLELDRRDSRYKRAEALSSAHKWLLVTCFGYLGYKNARFGRIEAHEAVTAYGRECLLRAKEAAEDLGFRVLHIYVDGLWVQKEGAKQVNDFQPLLEEI